MVLEADHSSICKFASADCPKCELVVETINMEIERALKNVKCCKSQTSQAFSSLCLTGTEGYAR